MLIISLLMLLTPGLIALRIRWRRKTIRRADIKYLISDYLILSFIIMIIDYLVMFLSYTERTVSFSVKLMKYDSNIYSASFIVKYSLTALVLAFVIPYLWQTIFNRPNKKDKK